jgi:23S rRNA (adenine2503-C2)-methyltransferase
MFGKSTNLATWTTSTEKVNNQEYFIAYTSTAVDTSDLVVYTEPTDFKLNLIPYNTVDGVNLKRPQSKVIEEFQKELILSGVKVTRRYTKGKDIDAACGQLAYNKKNS